MKILKCLFIGLSIFSTLSTTAQAPVKQWDKTFGGKRDEELKVIFQLADDSFVYGGSTKSNDNNKGGYDFIVSKLNQQGALQWQRSFGGDKEDILTSMLPLADGGFIIAGSSASGKGPVKSQNSWGETDYWVLRVNKKGEILWDKRYGGTSIDNLTSIDLTSDGGFILGGYSWSDDNGNISDTGRGKSDYWILKINANGDKLWDKRFGGVDFDELYKVKEAIDGGFILAGYSYYGISGDKTQEGQGNCDYWVVKTDGSGNKLWDKRFGGLDYEHLYDMNEASTGDIYLGGDSRSKASGDKSQNTRGKYDFWLVKMNSNGTKIWDRRFGGKEFDVPTSLQIASDGAVLIGGESASGADGDKSQPSKGESDYWLLKIDAAGDKLWDASFGGSGNDYLQSFQETSDGGYILGGISRSNISGDKSQKSKGGYDFWIVKTGSNLQTSVDILSKQNSTLRISISPNPATDFITVKCSNATSNLQVINSIGMGVKSQIEDLGNNTYQINIKDIEPGVYYIETITNSGEHIVEKWIKQ